MHVTAESLEDTAKVPGLSNYIVYRTRLESVNYTDDHHRSLKVLALWVLYDGRDSRKHPPNT
jgi:hypothetical protein